MLCCYTTLPSPSALVSILSPFSLIFCFVFGQELHCFASHCSHSTAAVFTHQIYCALPIRELRSDHSHYIINMTESLCRYTLSLPFKSKCKSLSQVTLTACSNLILFHGSACFRSMSCDCSAQDEHVDSSHTSSPLYIRVTLDVEGSSPY